MKTMTPSLRTRVPLTAAAFSALALSFTMLCPAADATDPPTAIVKYYDLNIATPQGATVLYGRIRRAAEIVCGAPDGRDLVFWARTAACMHHAIADAVSKVGEPALFTVYNANNSTPLPAPLVSQRR
jgi:UrcA family protein